jgi:hypothetical protein
MMFSSGNNSSSRGFPLVVLVLLLALVFVPNSVLADPTACDGDDGGIANCCAGDSTTSTCETCRVGYGLVKNSCLKCKNPKCAYCNGDTSTCKASDMYAGNIAHCSTPSYVDCIEVLPLFFPYCFTFIHDSNII